MLDRATFGAWVLDFLIFGNAYLETRRSRTGRPVALKHALSKYKRRGADLEGYFFVRGWKDEHEFRPGTVHRMREADINQEVHGLPEYLSALQSAWLNESATLFRRRYYNSGSHAGFILYVRPNEMAGVEYAINGAGEGSFFGFAVAGDVGAPGRALGKRVTARACFDRRADNTRFNAFTSI